MIAIFGLTASKLAQGKYALLDENEADEREKKGDRYGAIGRRQTADAAWDRVFDHIGTDGAYWDRKRS